MQFLLCRNKKKYKMKISNNFIIQILRHEDFYKYDTRILFLLLKISRNGLLNAVYFMFALFMAKVLPLSSSILSNIKKLGVL